MTKDQENDLRDCWEAAMDWETAAGCCGIHLKPFDANHAYWAARKLWLELEAAFER